MFEITNRTSAPYSSICYIRCDWPNGTSSRASGVIVGVNDVLTALHTVYDASLGGWASRVTVIPGADTVPVSRPYGEFSDVGLFAGRSGNWDWNGDRLLSQTESEGDLALLGMRTRIGDVAGVLPVAPVNSDISGQIVGYPGRGSGMMAENVFADAATFNSVYNVNAGLGAGASGGPLLWWNGGTPTVVGVLSSGDAANTTSTYAGLQSPDTWNWLQRAMAENDSLIGGGLPSSVATATGLVFTGSANPDNLAGGNGWDTFTGGAGDDVLTGGEGIDTAIYTAVRAAYRVERSGDAVVVSDTVPSRDGLDILRSVERVKFTDHALAFDVGGSAGKAFRLYEAAFNRAPEMAGLGFQMKALDDGWALSQVAANFVASPEFQQKYGVLDATGFVQQLYRNVLGREGEAAGVAYHVDRLANGATRGDVLGGFSESQENQVAVIGQIENGMAYTV